METDSQASISDDKGLIGLISDNISKKGYAYEP